ncbi:MAG TPA: NAD(P)-dependent oxidoreductase [Terriglobales bacterium]|nr:NAD(P)-dependent oxidoreductase [Terriglobales bacterium]
MRAILVTGAAGFIGRAACDALRRTELEFVAVDKSCSEQVIACDLGDNQSLKSLFTAHHFGTIIHLAAMLPGAAAVDPLEAARINVSASVQLLENALSAKVKRFVFGSSTSVYGSAGVSSPISEEVPAAPCDVYGAAKRFIEVIGENLQRQEKIEFVSLRIATVVGPGARNTSSPWRSEIFEKLGKKTRPTISLPYSSQDPLTVVHVDDTARMLVLLAQANSIKHTVYNTPAELTSAGELKRVVESIDPQIQVELAGRARPLAPLADGTRFAKEFGFEISRLESSLKQQAKRN